MTSPRGVFANRTLNLRSIEAIGYDLDYTLVHYDTEAWESRAFAHTVARLADRGWPVSGLTFDASQVIQGLTIDLATGNLLKVTRFGYVIRAAHGTRFLEFGELRRAYAGTVVDLAEERFVFINTLFSLSEASLYAQLVDLADAGRIPEVVGYDDLYAVVATALDEAHMEGTLKAEILADPDRFIEPDPLVVETLEDQRAAGKQLMLITNSEWAYARRVLEHAVDPYLAQGRSWRELFDVVIVAAEKPGFFAGDHRLYHVTDEERGLLRPHVGRIEPGSVFYGGCARRVEESLGLSGDQILYVGDHLFGDVHASKAMLRWRTALVLRDLESEVEALLGFAESEQELLQLMYAKEGLERQIAELRLARHHDGLDHAELDVVRAALAELDDRIAPLAIAAGELSNSTWGLLMRAGVDKSLFARQMERYADVYTSRVSNLHAATPYALFRAFRAVLPHDPL